MLIGYWTDPYKEEILYGAYSRTYRDLDPNTLQDFTQLYLGRDQYMITKPAFMHNMRYLLDNLHPGHLYTEDYLIKNHTLLPAFVPFLSTTTSQKIVDSIYTDSREAKNGLTQWRLPSQNGLLYCPACVEKDINVVGEPYFHRVHQFPCVYVCPEHGVWLKTYPSFAEFETHTFKLITLDENIATKEPTTIDITDTTERILLEYAEWVLSLLQKGDFVSIDFEMFKKSCKRLLAEKGLATYKGVVR